MKNILIYTSFILYSLFAAANISAANNSIFFEHYSNTYITEFNNNNDYDLMLTGVVLCESTGARLADITVTLEDLLTKETRKYQTRDDGTYYFILERDKRYFLSCNPTPTDEKGGKTISTIDKYDEVLNSLLQVSACGDEGFGVDESKMLADETTDNNAKTNGMPKLSYRIQIGVFKQRRSEQSDFIRNTGFKIVEEQAPNGFYRYLTEDFYSLEGTKDKVNALKVKGYDKAYIVPYFEGKRTKLSPEQAKEKHGNIGKK